MKSIGFEDIVDVMLNIADPNTGGAISSVPGVSSPKINGATSVYNVEAEGGSGIAGWSTDAKWTAGVGSISWTSGSISLPDGNQISISSGSATVTAPTYIYVDMEDGTVYSTTHSYEAVGENKIMICAAFPNSGKNVTFKAFGCADQSSLTTGADIATGTIVASNIASNTITADQIASGTITANEIASNTITASEIDTGAVTAAKIDVSELSAISADLGTITAGTITGTTITAGDTDSTAVVLNPNNNRIEIYYNGNQVGSIVGMYASGLGNVLGLLGSRVYIDQKLLVGGKLRIPIGTDLYD